MPALRRGAAAKAATKTIPIVFGVAEDPVKLGLVASLARPGGNVTGINFLARRAGGQATELLHDLVPSARVAVLVNPANVRPPHHAARHAGSGTRLGLRIRVLNASTSSEIDAAFATFVRDRTDALFVAPERCSSAAGAYNIVQLAAQS